VVNPAFSLGVTTGFTFITASATLSRGVESGFENPLSVRTLPIKKEKKEKRKKKKKMQFRIEENCDKVSSFLY
jgi:hypothetical protein